MAQDRLEANRKQYRNPKETQLLSGLVRCGECGKFFTSYQRYYRSHKTKQDKYHVFHKIAYRCSQRTQQRMHSKHADIVRCKNPEVASHLLESCVFEIIKNIMINPDKLKKNIRYFKEKSDSDHLRIEKKLKGIEQNIHRLEKQKRSIVDLYARSNLDRVTYTQRCILYDNEIAKKKIERDGLIKKIPILHKSEVIEMSVGAYSESIKTRLEKCADFESKRKFLLEFIEKIIYKNGRITLCGSVPMRLGGDTEKISFSIQS